MVDWFGPQQDWPVHQGPRWQAPLTKARDDGWYLAQFRGHASGLIRCMPPGVADACELTFPSTAKPTENLAREFAKKITRCKHRARRARPPLDRAEELLTTAARLADAAERCLSRDRHAGEQLRYELLADRLIVFSAQRRAIDEALKAARRREADDVSIDKALENVPVDSPGPPTAPDFGVPAEVLVAEALAALRGQPPRTRRKELRKRADDLGTRFEDLRGRHRSNPQL